MHPTTTRIPCASPRNGDNQPSSLCWNVDDIHVESTPLTTTGGHTWPAARHLLRYLEYCYATDTHAMRSTQPLRVLELGAGCGWLGIVLASNIPTARVCVTEQEAGGALDWLQHNVRRAGLANIWTAPCDWTQALDAVGANSTTAVDARCSTDNSGTYTSSGNQHSDHRPAANVLTEPWDLVIGSDLVYNQAGTQWLPLVFAALLKRAPCALYCHTKHRYDLLDMEFFEALEGCGVAWREVWDPAWDPPPASPPLCFPGELFGEQRIAVFALTLAR